MDFNPGLLRTSIAHMWCRTPLPSLSVPVPGHCSLNGSWLAIWTGKCAKGWHMIWIAVAHLFHTIERNTERKKKAVREGTWNPVCPRWPLSVMWHFDVINATETRKLGCFVWMLYCLFGVHDGWVLASWLHLNIPGFAYTTDKQHQGLYKQPQHDNPSSIKAFFERMR